MRKFVCVLVLSLVAVFPAAADEIDSEDLDAAIVETGSQAQPYVEIVNEAQVNLGPLSDASVDPFDSEGPLGVANEEQFDHTAALLLDKLGLRMEVPSEDELVRFTIASPASDSDYAGSWMPSCVMYAKPPVKEYRKISGFGSVQCSSKVNGVLRVSLQRHRWYGWQSVAKGTNSGLKTFWSKHAGPYECTRGQTFTYRTTVSFDYQTMTAGWQTWGPHKSEERRFTC